MSFDDLRALIAKVDALAHAAQSMFDETLWGGEVDMQRLDRVAHLIGATADAAEIAIVAVDGFNAATLVNPVANGSNPTDWE